MNKSAWASQNKPYRLDIKKTLGFKDGDFETIYQFEWYTEITWMSNSVFQGNHNTVASSNREINSVIQVKGTPNVYIQISSRLTEPRICFIEKESTTWMVKLVPFSKRFAFTF